MTSCRIFLIGTVVCIAGVLGVDFNLQKSFAQKQEFQKEPVFKVGFAERDITPAKGMEQPCAYSKVFNQGIIHDCCKARATVFDDGKTRIAIVGLDTSKVPQQLVKAAREEILKKCGISPESVLINASHTHSAGPLGFVQPGEFDHASDFVKHLAYDITPCADVKYIEVVKRAIIEAVQ